MTRAILLVPAPEYRDALLREGPCGSRPPTAWRPWCEDYGSPTGGAWSSEWATYEDRDDSPEDSAALVLAWDGAAVAEGCDRAARTLADATREPAHYWRAAYDEHAVRVLADACAAGGLGSVVMLKE